MGVLALFLALTVGVGIAALCGGVQREALRVEGSEPAVSASAFSPSQETTTTSTTTTTEPAPSTTSPPPTTAPRPVAPRVEAQSGYPPECDNPVVAPRIAWAESHCRWDNYNPTGCGGRGCLGYFQLDEGHFAAVSPWNPNVSGGCVDLAAVKWEPWAQTECASRLGPGAWG